MYPWKFWDRCHRFPLPLSKPLSILNIPRVLNLTMVGNIEKIRYMGFSQGPPYNETDSKWSAQANAFYSVRHMTDALNLQS